MARNRYAPKSQWKKWSKKAQQVFNDLYETMRDNKKLFLHPDQEPPSKEHWRTTCHNAAWMAADFIDDAE